MRAGVQPVSFETGSNVRKLRKDRTLLTKIEKPEEKHRFLLFSNSLLRLWIFAPPITHPPRLSGIGMPRTFGPAQFAG
jgi:hypothetical protein